MTLNYNAETQEYTITVKVTNTGKVPGKETVQISVQSPYTQYAIDNKVEKASVQTDGSWAKIFKTTESPEEQPGGNTL